MKKKWLSILLIMSILFSFCACATQPSDTHQNKTKSATKIDKRQAENFDGKSPSTSPTPLTEENAETISKSEYNRIKDGMSYEEIRDIIGSDGIKISESGTEGEVGYKVTYSWDGEGAEDAKASFMLEDNKLKAKSEVGLE